MFRVDTSTAAETLAAPGPAGTPGYFQSGDPQSGTAATVPGADWFNAVQEEILSVIEGAGLDPNKADRAQLYAAIQNMVLSLGGGALLPIYPLVETADNKLPVLSGSGAVSVATGHSFIWRGSRRINTSDFLEAARTFPIVANKTYHMRWSQSGGFVLKDLADAGYNPSSLAETDTSFDTTYDDMLVARVVTDGANNPTIASLRNAPILRARMSGLTNASIHDGLRLWTLDWSRAPIYTQAWKTTFGDDTHHSLQRISAESVSRYSIPHRAWFTLSLSGNVQNSTGSGDRIFEQTAEA